MANNDKKPTTDMQADAGQDDQSKPDMEQDGQRREPIHPDDVESGATGKPQNGRREMVHPDDVKTDDGGAASGTGKASGKPSSDMDQGVADRMNGGIT